MHPTRTRARRLALLIAATAALGAAGPISSAVASCSPFDVELGGPHIIGQLCVNDVSDATAGQAFTEDVITLTISGSPVPPAVTVSWGDGSAPEPANFPSFAGGTLSLTHTYASPGVYPIIATDPFGLGITAGGFATVAPSNDPCQQPGVIQGTEDDDVLTGTEGDDVICARGGNDSIHGLEGNDTIYGGQGNDTLIGGTGNDLLDGGEGNDLLRGGRGDDVQNGGTGVDLSDYLGRGRALSLSLDGVANDGQPGEHDNIGTDVENLRGGDGDDVLVGNDQRNVLTGGPGDDDLQGGANTDTLRGGSGADVYEGDAGMDTADYRDEDNDITVTIGAGNHDDGEDGEGDDVRTDIERVYGGDGDDVLKARPIGHNVRRLFGGPGNDTLVGGPAADFLYGGSGNDDISADESALGQAPTLDVIDCGTGQDTLLADALDLTVGTPGCEGVPI